MDVDLRVGGAMSFDFPNGGPDEMKGEVTELEPPPPAPPLAGTCVSTGSTSL